MSRFDDVPQISAIDQISLSARTAGTQLKLSDYFLPLTDDVSFRKVLLNNLTYVGNAISERLGQQVALDAGLSDVIPTDAEYMDGWDYIPAPPAEGGE